MEKLKYLIGIFFLLLVNVTARAEEIYAVSENIRDLDNIENRIFRDIDLMIFLPSENEWKALQGIEYLYCSVVADILDDRDNAKIFYKDGMDFLDFHAKEFVSDKSSIKRSMILERVDHIASKYYFFDQKETFKGALFATLFNNIEDTYVSVGPTRHLVALKFRSSYERHCKK
ncbi:hypothetical protein [Acinetobacter sp.]|uniref:hypothetical protein n=1 Tax=Acinetobacter sp. TaxID=472 RepID=UPI00289943D7|nr:hypothetical protein [Acinetobacter sp.]